MADAPHAQSASASADGTVKLWDVNEEQACERLRSPIVSARAMALAPDGQTLAVSDVDGRVHLLDPQTLRRILERTEWPGLVIVDTKSDLEALTRNALHAADRVLVPVSDWATIVPRVSNTPHARSCDSRTTVENAVRMSAACCSLVTDRSRLHSTSSAIGSIVVIASRADS